MKTDWKKGDRCLLSRGSLTVEAEVLLASSNGVSLALSFDDMVDGYAGMMPVLLQDGEYRDLARMEPVKLSER